MRLVHQRGHPVERAGRRRAGLAADGVQRGEVGAAREHRHPGEEPLLRLVQQPVGPVDRGGDALVAGLRRAGGAGEQVAVVEPLGDLGGAHRPGAGRGQLDAERQAVEPSADLGDRAAVGVEVGAGGPRPQHEQGGGVRERERRHRPHLLAVDAERLPARGEHDDAGALRDDALGQPCGGVQHVLAVVEHEQQRPGGEVLDDRLLDRRGRGAAASAARPRRRVPTEPPSARGASSASHAPSANRSRSRPATSTASRVFPTPPTPTSVTSGADRSASAHRVDRLVPPDQRGAAARQVGRAGRSRRARASGPARAPGGAARGWRRTARRPAPRRGGGAGPGRRPARRPAARSRRGRASAGRPGSPGPGAARPAPRARRRPPGRGPARAAPPPAPRRRRGAGRPGARAWPSRSMSAASNSSSGSPRQRPSAVSRRSTAARWSPTAARSRASPVRRWNSAASSSPSATSSA